jgi:WD40 repeat protein
MSGDPRGRLTIWNLETGGVLREFSMEGGVSGLQFAPDGERFAVVRSVAGKELVAVCDADTGAIQFSDPGPQASAIEWHPAGQWVALLELDGRIRLIDPKSGAESILGRHKAQAVSATFSPDGRFLITGGWEAELICWDLQTHERAFTIGLNSWRPSFRQDGRQCAIEMRDRVQIYEFQTPDCFRELAGDSEQRIVRGAFSENGRWTAAGRENGFMVWDLQNPAPPAVVTNGCRRLLFDPAGNELFAFKDGLLTRWQLTPGPPGESPQLNDLPVFAPPGLFTASLRSNELVLTGFDGIGFLDLTNAEVSPHHQQKKAEGWSGVSPDGRWLAVKYGISPLLRVYRLPEVELTAWLTNRSDVWTFAFSSQELAVATRTGLEFYDTTRWQRTRELAVPGERQSEIIYTPDESALWYTSDGRTSALRDARTLDVVLPLPAGTLPLALSADGRRLAVSVDTRRVQVWELAKVREQLRGLGVDWIGR